MDASLPFPPLNAQQRDLLRMFQRDLTPEQWEELRQVVARFFADLATREADQLWEARGWTEADADRLLHADLRTEDPSGAA